MSDEFETFVEGASAAQLTRIIGLIGGEFGSTDAVIPQLADPTEFVALLAEVAPGGEAEAERLAALVVDPGAPLAQLEVTLNEARTLIGRAAGTGPRAAAELLYQAAIAAAHVRHGVNLGSRPLAERQELHVKLARELTPSPLGALFAAAIT